jgi:hypothetical protein
MTSDWMKKWMAAMIALMLAAFPVLAEPAEEENQTASETAPAAHQTAEAESRQMPEAENGQDEEQHDLSQPQVTEAPSPQPTHTPAEEPAPEDQNTPAPTSQPTATDLVSEPARVWFEGSREAFSAGQVMKCVLRREGGEQAIEVRYVFNGQTRVQTMEAGENSVRLKLGEAPASDSGLSYKLEILESEAYEIKEGNLEIRVVPVPLFGFETAFAGSVGAASGDSCKIIIRRAENGAQQAARLALTMPDSAYEAGYRLTGDQRHFQLDTTYYIDFRKGEQEKAVYLSNWSAEPSKSSTISLSLQGEQDAMVKEDAARVSVTLEARDSDRRRAVGRFQEDELYITPGEERTVRLALDWAKGSGSARLRYEITDGQNYCLKADQKLTNGQKQVEIPLPTADFEVGKSYVVNILPEGKDDVGSTEQSSLVLHVIEASENATASLDSEEYLIMPGQSLKVEITIDKAQTRQTAFQLSMGEQQWPALLPAGETKLELELDAVEKSGSLKLSAPDGIALNIGQANVVVSAALSDNLNFLSGRMVYCGGDGGAQVYIKIAEPLDESAQFVLGISDDHTGNMVNMTIPAGCRVYQAELPERMMNDYQAGTTCQLTLDMPNEAWQGKIAQATLSVLENAPDLARFEVAEELNAQVGERLEVPLDLPQNFEGMVVLTDPNGKRQMLYPRYPSGSVEVELKQEGRYFLVLSDEKNGWVDENMREVVIFASIQ